MQGIVVAAKSPKTVAVSVERVFQHPLYKKIIRRKKKVLAHDEQGQCQPGDVVTVKLVRPISKLKRWLVVKVVAKGRLKEVQDDSNANPAENSR